MTPKYLRTHHLTISSGTSDDKIHESDEIFLNKEIIITAKLDGSNFCMTNTECFARSHAHAPKHKSFDYAKKIHNEIKNLIDSNIVIYMENCFAKHAIHYTNLPHYLAIFNILDISKNKWLSWNDVEFYASVLNIPTVPVLFQGSFDKLSDLHSKIFSLMKEKEFDINEREGVVIRTINEFDNKDFKNSIGKFVRKNHVQMGDEHWMHKDIIKNELSK